MGLTIHYALAAPALTDFAAAQALVEKLHAFAHSLHFNTCTDLITWDEQQGDDPDFGHFRDYLLCYDQTQGAERFLLVPPHHFVMFGVSQPGSETAFFGLGKYAAEAPDIQDPSIRRQTDLAGYCWRTFCKTQYASLASEGGGWENFFKIHDGICQILDHARSLGLEVSAHDESRYWETRDPAALHSEIDRWNALMAAFTGRMKDHYKARGKKDIVSPITQSPDFEHLEAKGQEIIGDFDPADLERLLEEPPESKA